MGERPYQSVQNHNTSHPKNGHPTTPSATRKISILDRYGLVPNNQISRLISELPSHKVLSTPDWEQFGLVRTGHVVLAAVDPPLAPTIKSGMGNLSPRPLRCLGLLGVLLSAGELQAQTVSSPTGSISTGTPSAESTNPTSPTDQLTGTKSSSEKFFIVRLYNGTKYCGSLVERKEGKWITLQIGEEKREFEWTEFDARNVIEVSICLTDRATETQSIPLGGTSSQQTEKSVQDPSTEFQVFCKTDANGAVYLEHLFRTDREWVPGKDKISTVSFGKFGSFSSPYRTAAKYEFTENWTQICQCPCGIKIPQFDRYRFSGQSIIRSESFAFPYTSRQSAQFSVKTASLARQIGGTFLLTVGILASSVGIGFAINAEVINSRLPSGVVSMSDSMQVSQSRIIGYPALVAGIVAVTLGSIIVTPTKTRVYDEKKKELSYAAAGENVKEAEPKSK